jgi:competence protein ComEC
MTVKRFRWVIVVLFLFSLTLAVLAARYSLLHGSDVEWAMINVNQSKQQADAHLIQVKNGKTILIDAGHRNTAKSMLLPYLRQHAVNKIDIVFITHPHVDHYGGLEYLLKNKIKIGEVYFNLPDKKTCDSEIPWGCNYIDVLTVRNIYSQYGVPPKNVKAGMKFNLGPDTWMEIVYAFDGIHTPVGKTSINDMSLVMMLHYKKFKCLFTGDLDGKIGTYAAKFPDLIAADVLKVPHHGTESTVPDAFFDAVSPKYALVPSPEGLWLSHRSERIRSWFSKHGIPIYVNGISGDVQVSIRGTHLIVTPEADN